MEKGHWIGVKGFFCSKRLYMPCIHTNIKVKHSTHAAAVATLADPLASSTKVGIDGTFGHGFLIAS